MPFISTSSPIWLKCLLIPEHDIYHLPGYCNLEASMLNGEPIAWWTEMEGVDFIIPLISREFETNGLVCRDLVSPYGYPGILYPALTPGELISRAIRQFHLEAGGNGYVSTFIRLHPFLNNFQAENTVWLAQEFHGLTITISLDQPIEAIRSVFSENHKRNLKKLNRGNFSVKVNQWDYLNDFAIVYLDTMKRKGAGKRYFFDFPYFDGLHQIAANSLLLITVHDNTDKVAAGGLFTLFNGLVQFHLGGTSSEHIALSPSKLMIDATISACKNLGAGTLHLGGGYSSSNENGLFRFKAGFGHEYKKFSTLSFIHDSEKYKHLLEASNTVAPKAGNYFPAYRT